tara:strand:- start:1073 stop:1231 length:159 start_codon:yes stop_codon:yes gene_type:complete
MGAIKPEKLKTIHCLWVVLKTTEYEQNSVEENWDYYYTISRCHGYCPDEQNG